MRLLRNSIIPLLMIIKASIASTARKSIPPSTFSENMATPTKPINAMTAIKNKAARVPSTIRIGSGTLLLLLNSKLPSTMRSKRNSKSISMIVSPNKQQEYM